MVEKNSNKDQKENSRVYLKENSKENLNKGNLINHNNKKLKTRITDYFDPILRSRIISYYKQKYIQNAIYENSINKEIAVKYINGGFGKRPDKIEYPQEVLDSVLRGAISFHSSEELWEDPMLIAETKDLNSIRIGWDMIFDIDCPVFEYSRITAINIIDFLKNKYNIDAIFIKYSGNKGFHIAIPFEAFPKIINNNKVSDKFPEYPKAIALYVFDKISNKISDDLIEFEGNIHNISVKLNKKKEELIKKINNQGYDDYSDITLNIFNIIDIDTILISSRHLYRMPYSIHEKSLLVSLPLELNQIKSFKKENAKLNQVDDSYPLLFIKRDIDVQADSLLRDAIDFIKKNKIHDEFNKELKRIKSRKRINDKSNITNTNQDSKYKTLTYKANISDFPNCIKNILNGLEDGRKRSLFILILFLINANWNFDEIEELIFEWNDKNKEPLRDNYIKSQLNYFKNKFKNKKDVILPPNCNRDEYYKDLSVCDPDHICKYIKNPVNYLIIKQQKIKETYKIKKNIKKNKKDNKNKNKKYTNERSYQKETNKKKIN